MIEPDTFPTLTPYFIDPTKVDDTRGLLKEKASKFLVKTLLIDPYTPLHLYTGILPIKTLQLPGWSLEAAMKNMSSSLPSLSSSTRIPALRSYLNAKSNI